MTDQPSPPEIVADRIESGLDIPLVACIVIDGIKTYVRRADRMGVATAEMDGVAVVTVGFARPSMGIETGLYTALTPDEARAMALSLERSAAMAEFPSLPLLGGK